MKRKIYKRLERPHRWLTESIAKTYRDTFESIADNGEIKGAAKGLVIALIADCSITELEAILIVTGKACIKEIVSKYRRRKAEYEANLKAPEEAFRSEREKRKGIKEGIFGLDENMLDLEVQHEF